MQQKQTKETPQKVDASKSKKTKKGVQFSFVVPEKKYQMYAVILLVLGLCCFAATLFIGSTDHTVDNLKNSIKVFDQQDGSIEQQFYINKMRESLDEDMNIALHEEDIESVMSKNGIQHMYYLSQLGKTVTKEDVMELFNEYGFIEDSEKIIEELEPELDDDTFGEIVEDEEEDEKDEKQPEIIEKSKPQSVMATYFAHQILKSIGAFEEYKQSEEYLNTIRFVLRMQKNTTGVIFDSKEGYSDIEVLYAATSLLIDAVNVEQYKNEISTALDLLRKLFEKMVLLDGSFDFTLQQTNSSCIGTSFGYLSMKQLGLSINTNTYRYLTRCISPEGPLIELNGDYIHLESGYLLSEIRKEIPKSILTEDVLASDFAVSIGIIFIGFAVSILFVDTFPTTYVKEYGFSTVMFIICGVISVFFIESTYLPFLFFPVAVMGYTHYYKWMGPFIKDEFFSTLSMIPPMFGVGFYILVQRIFPEYFITMKFVPLVWVLYVTGSYFAVPIAKNFFSKQKHGINYYAASNAIGFSMMIICMFVMIAMSKVRVFILSNIDLTGGYFTLFVAMPAIGYILSMIACGFSIPTISKLALAKEKKKN